MLLLLYHNFLSHPLPFHAIITINTVRVSLASSYLTYERQTQSGSKKGTTVSERIAYLNCFPSAHS